VSARLAASILRNAVLAISLSLAVPALAQDLPDICSAPRSALTLGAPLTRAGSLLLHGLPLRIVALGSSSTAGVGASDAAHSYPAQLALELKRRFPRSAITVLNKGVSGEETQDMLARFDRDVLAQSPDLVIWQVGSNEILHKDGNLARFKREVLNGLARLKAAKIETVLMDAQYAPAILKNSEYPAFNDALRQIAHTANIALFDRFEAMRFWLASGHQKLSQMVSPDDVHMTDAGYHCVGRLLASLIASDLPTLASR